MEQGKIIAVSGIMGSGKTTLCQSLSQNMGWVCLQEPASAKNYLADFFNDLDRYAYPTQMAFLCNKALQIIQALQKGQNVIIDRSLYEDVYIFARCWHDRGNIDERDFTIYTELAEFFLKQIPDPQLILYCECSLQEAKKRIAKRNRCDQKNFPDNHMEDIQERYNNWLINYRASPVYSVNTEKNDIRIPRVVKRIINEIYEIGIEKQLTLFDYEQIETEPTERTLKPIISIDEFGKDYSLSSFSKAKQSTYSLVHPWAYLAAPFTSIATIDSETSVKDNQLTFEKNAPLHGVIKPGEYKKMLLDIEKALKKLCVNTVIPHRDVNKWGKKVLTPQKATRNCEYLVKECDLFIGIIGESNGSHYELGIAEGMLKPIVVIVCEEISTSFIGSGIVDSNRRLILNCKRIVDIPKIFESDEFLYFISKVL